MVKKVMNKMVMIKMTSRAVSALGLIRVPLCLGADATQLAKIFITARERFDRRFIIQSPLRHSWHDRVFPNSVAEALNPTTTWQWILPF
jgi:hypothetical protein